MTEITKTPAAETSTERRPLGVKCSDLLALLGLKLGDYCHAHRWADADPEDPFAIGFLKSVMLNEKGIFYALEGDGVPDRYFQHCEMVTPEKGKELLAR